MRFGEALDKRPEEDTIVGLLEETTNEDMLIMTELFTCDVEDGSVRGVESPAVVTMEDMNNLVLFTEGVVVVLETNTVD